VPILVVMRDSPFLEEERIGTRAGVGKGSEALEGSQGWHFVKDAGAGAMVC